MNGAQLVKILEEEFSTKIGAATKSNWKKKSQISPTIFPNALKKVQIHATSNAIVPIVEYHSVKWDHDKKVDSFANRLNSASLIKKLQAQNGGIYAFFNATGELLYVGKTTKNLFTEIQQRYNNKKVHCRIIKDSKTAWKTWVIKDVAEFISAYGVEKAFVTNIEALLTRLTINIAQNVRVERFR